MPRIFLALVYACAECACTYYCNALNAVTTRSRVRLLWCYVQSESDLTFSLTDIDVAETKVMDTDLVAR